MSRWVRLWEDMPDDPKWLVVRNRALQSVTGVTVGHVISVFVKMITNSDSQGNLVNWSDEDVAVRLEYETEQVSAIRDAMQGKVLDGNYLKGWTKRQPKREDDSTKRVQALRAKRNAVKLGETQLKRGVTQRNAPEEKRIESDLKKTSFFLNAREARSKNKTRKTQIQEKAEPTASQIEASTERRLSEPERRDEWIKFKNHHRANGNRFSDWLAAWCMWLDKRITLGVKPNGHAPDKPQIFVEEDTPQWIAWDEFWKKSKGKPLPKITYNNLGKARWMVDTEWPPKC